jgi:hypothetical protein
MAVWRDIDSDVRINGSLVLPTGSLTIGGNNIITLINGKVDTSRSITAGTGLTGGGDFTADRTISVSFGTTAGTVAEGNHGHGISGITGLTDALAGKASTTHNHDTVYLGIGATAVDSAKLNGQAASYYATSSALTGHTGDSTIHKSWGNWDTATNDFRVNAKVLLSHNTTTNKVFINPGKAFAGVDIVGSATVDGNGIWHAGNLSKTDFITATDPASVVSGFTVKGRIYAGDTANAGSILIKDSAFQDTIRLGGLADDSKTKAWIAETGYARFRNTVRVASLEIDTSSMITNLNAEYLNGYRADTFVRAISVRDIAGYGVSHGYAVISQSPVSNSVNISPGLVITDSGKRYETSAIQQLALAGAPGTGYNRVDIVFIIGSKTKDTNGAYISTGVNEGTVGVYQGAAVSGTPTAPYTQLYAEYPEAIPLAEINRPALINDIDADKIKDVRKYAAVTSPKDATVEVRRKLNVSDEVTATKFNGSGAGLTNIPVNQFGANRIAKANLDANTMYLNDVQTITANKTFSNAANLYFAGGTSYWISSLGHARLNQVEVVADLLINKSSNYSRIKFPAQTNDPGEITHYENNNASVMYFSASDDPGDTDYFSFGSRTPGSTYLEGAKITTAGNATFAGITGTGLTINGDVEIVGELKAGGPNEFPDPLMASATTSMWTSSKSASATISLDNTQVPSGTGAVYSVKVEATAADAWAYYNRRIDVKPGEWVTFSAYVFSTTTGKTAQLYFEFVKADGTLATGTPHVSNNFTAPTSWGRFKVTAQAPADAAHLRVRIDNDGNAGSTIYFAAFQVERGRTMTAFKPFQGNSNVSLFDHSGWGYLRAGNYPGIALNSAADEINIGGSSSTIRLKNKVVLQDTGALAVSDGTNTLDFLTFYGPYDYGFGAIMQSGGAMFVGSGESASVAKASRNTLSGLEDMHLTADGGLYFYSNIGGGWAGRNYMLFNSTGLAINKESGATVPLDVNGVIKASGEIQTSSHFRTTQNAYIEHLYLGEAGGTVSEGNIYNLDQLHGTNDIRFSIGQTASTNHHMTASSLAINKNTTAVSGVNLEVVGKTRTTTTLEVGSGTAANDLTVTSSGAFNWRNTIYSGTAGKVSINKTSNSVHPLDVKSNQSYEGINIQRTLTTDISGLSYQNADNNYTWHVAQSQAAASDLVFYSGITASMSALTEKVRIRNSGGIVIQDPGRTIGGTTMDNGWLLLGTAAQGLSMDANEIYFSGTTGIIGTIGAQDITFTPNSITKMTIKADGKVGIGTTAPAEALHVAGNLYVSGVIRFSDDATAGNIVFTDSNTMAQTGFYSSADGFTMQADSSPTNTVVKTGHVHATGAVYADKIMGTGKFAMEYNTTEDSLDFVYVG